MLDEKSRIAGWINVIDLLVALLLCAVAATAYVRLTKPYRIAQPYRTNASRHWVNVEMRLPEDRLWMADIIRPGIHQVDARSGEAILEILGVRPAPDHLILSVRVSALVDGQGRLVYQDRLLVPGLVIVVETDAFAFQGWVTRVSGPAADAP